MFLEKIELQGFKSFANRTILEFPQKGKNKYSVTAVVGPNGAGKSNIVDAIKWVLGEQSVKMIRGKKSEDVIFSGSSKKARLGFAQVSLYLNNEDKKAPIDYNQLVITRRVFRDGEAEYLINKNKVRLFDIIILLAKANFGQKSYSIISQGKIDSVIVATPAERKNFFDEAVGIKEFQIKRDRALSKLERTEDNLNQAEILINEIEPRLKSLTRQVKKLEKRDKIQSELRQYQQVYYSNIWCDLEKNISTYNSKYKTVENQKSLIVKKLDQIKLDLSNLEKEESRTVIFSNLQGQYTKLITQKNDLLRQQTVLKGRLDLEFEKQGKLNLAWLYRKEEELKNKIEETQKELKDLTAKLLKTTQILSEKISEEEKSGKQIKELDEKLTELKNKIKLDLTKEPLSILSKEISEINQEQEKLIKNLENISLETFQKDSNILNKIKDKAKKINKQLNDLTDTIKEQISTFSLEEKIKVSESSQIWQIQEKLNNLIAQKEELLIKINDLKIEKRVLEEKKDLLQKELDRLNIEIEKIKSEINQHKSSKDTTANYKKIDTENEQLQQKIDQINKDSEKLENKINEFNQDEEKKKEQLFKLEKEYQTNQHELNQFYKTLNDIKIELTRLETRKEDLENEIKKEMGSLNPISCDIKDMPQQIKNIESDKLFSHIEKLKYQMELIGGIDPETIDEYNETKERFEFLDDQSNDLTKAMDSLEKVIKELDEKIQKQFDSSFKKINTEFERYFKILFGGGKAKLTKIIEEPQPETQEMILPSEQEELESEIPEIEIIEKKKISRAKKYRITSYKGIEMYACPPGKKLKGVNMLSGGEKSLTSLALLSAIINSNPSPFVIFDEVDAALDEANSQRMAKIIQDLSTKTQFVIITHNRAIMNIADLIYGVTMGDDGVSKLLSVKFEEIDKHAARV